MNAHSLAQQGLDRRTLLGGGLAVGGAAAAAMLAGARGADAAALPAGPLVVVSTLNSQAIQAAINALPTSGGTVQLVDGTYNVTSSIVLRTTCALVGASRAGTILRLAPAVNANVIKNLDVVNGNPNIVVRSLTIDGNRAGQKAGTAAHGIEFHRCANLVIDDLEVHDCVTNGITLSGDGVITRVGRLSNVYAHDNGYNGLNSYWAMREMLYTGLICDRNGNDGIGLGHSEAVVSGVQCNRNGRDGFRVDSVFSTELTGITANLNGRNGIALVALIDSVGASWNAHNNGQKTAASDVFFDDHVISYGMSDHCVVSAVSCGPVHVSTWGTPYPQTPTETYGMSFASGIVGNIAVLGVYNSGGKLGRYLLPPVTAGSKLLITEHEFGQPDFRLVRGNFEIPGGNLAHGAGGNVGFYGTTPIAKPTVSGTTGGQPALKSLLAALAKLGLITNSTT